MPIYKFCIYCILCTFILHIAYCILLCVCVSLWYLACNSERSVKLCPRGQARELSCSVKIQISSRPAGALALALAKMQQYKDVSLFHSSWYCQTPMVQCNKKWFKQEVVFLFMEVTSLWGCGGSGCSLHSYVSTHWFCRKLEATETDCFWPDGKRDKFL